MDVVPPSDSGDRVTHMQDAYIPTIRTFQVFPDVPEALKPLLELAHNLWWVWHPDAVELFRRLDRNLWERSITTPSSCWAASSSEAGRRGAG